MEMITITNDLYQQLLVLLENHIDDLRSQHHRSRDHGARMAHMAAELDLPDFEADINASISDAQQALDELRDSR